MELTEEGRRPPPSQSVEEVTKREGRARGPEDDARHNNTRLSSKELRGESGLVTVVIPCYNQAHFLGEAVESVLAQTHPHLEIVVVDDGSTDDTSGVAARYPGVRLVRQENRGLSAARNSGLARGRGEYVVFLDADDRLLPEALEVGVRELEAHPECAFAFSEWVEIDEHGVEILQAPTTFPEGVISQLEAARWFIRHNTIVPPAIVLRRAACEAVGPFFDPKWQYFDWELWVRLAARFPIYYLARQDNDFRRHSAAFTYSEREPPQQLLDMFDHLEETLAREVDGFELSRIERARIRSQILLRAASDVHVGVGWKGSGPTYRRALREYPPTLFGRPSLTMLAKSLLGQRGSRLVSRLLRTVRPSSTRGPSA